MNLRIRDRLADAASQAQWDQAVVLLQTCDAVQAAEAYCRESRAVAEPIAFEKRAVPPKPGTQQLPRSRSYEPILRTYACPSTVIGLQPA
jgi:hypothetical protein